MEKEKINETHILVLKKLDELFCISEIKIEDSSSIIKQIEEAAKNSNNKTVLDIQHIFWDNFNCILNSYGYLYPYGYSNSYVQGAIKPQKWTKEKYEIEFQERLKKGEKKEEIEKKIKEQFSNSCKNYIKQQMLYNAYQKAINDSSVKMFSRESIGWSSFKYDISEDIKICLSTNFGYGLSSYFTLLVSYKDIDIAPFSHIARYYHADMIDIIKTTRSYGVERKNWLNVFIFVRDFTNDSLTNPEEFVKKRIAKEIEDMMCFLRDVMKNPKKYLCLFASEENEDYKTLRFISPMDDKDKKFLRVLPDEMNVVFQSEKLEEATYTTEKLKIFNSILPNIYDYINEISDIIVKLNPKIDKTIDGIQDKIDNDLAVRKKMEEEQLKNLYTQKHTLENEENSIGEKLYPTCKSPYFRPYHLSKGIEVIKKFRENNLEYILLESQENNSEEMFSEELKKKHDAQVEKLFTIIDEVFPHLWWGDRPNVIAAIDAIYSSEKKNPNYIRLEGQYKDICNQIEVINNQIETKRNEISNLEELISDRKNLIWRLSECQSVFNNYLSNKA